MTDKQFKMRTTKPEAGNKYYVTKANGGYSDAIKGKPTDTDCDVLSNCVGYAYGRFNEIGGYGYCKYLTPTNAENFIQYKDAELEVGQSPKVGACMVWKKGATFDGSDGAGHVAIVEKVISDTEVYTSESGWKSSKPFWNQTRKKGSGNWGKGSSYEFLGFIYNPAVNDVNTDVEESILPTPSTHKYEIGDIVSFTGDVHYFHSNATEAKSCTPGIAKITDIFLDSKHPYHLIATGKDESNVHGWVDENTISEVDHIEQPDSNVVSKNEVSIDYAESLSKALAGTYKTTAALNMRTGANTSKPILTVIPKGDSVTCYGYYTKTKGTKWYYVVYMDKKNNRYTGFVSSKYLQK